MKGANVLKTKRVYEKPEAGDGFRVLVDRLWPRGLKKTEAKIDLWLRQIAPSNDLRRWFGHDPGKCAEFRRRYSEELDAKDELLKQLVGKLGEGTVTLVYAAKYEECNNATVISEYLGKNVGKKGAVRRATATHKDREKSGGKTADC